MDQVLTLDRRQVLFFYERSGSALISAVSLEDDMAAYAAAVPHTVEKRMFQGNEDAESIADMGVVPWEAFAFLYGDPVMIPVFFLRVSKEVKWLVFGTYGLLVLSFATLTVQFYYFLTLFPFFALAVRLRVPKLLKNRKVLKVLIPIIILLAIATNWNIVTLVNGTFPTSVLEMADIINQNESEDSEVLTFSSYDTGIYQHTRHLPPNKNYFLSSILDPDIKAEQAALVASGKVKYLVREIGAINTCHEYYDAPVPANYRLIYDNEELFRYRFIWQPLSYLWNLTWPRPLLRHIMAPVTAQQHMQIYERE